MALTFYKETLMLRSWKALTRPSRQIRAAKIIQTLVRSQLRLAFTMLRTNPDDKNELLSRFIDYKNRRLKHNIITSWNKMMVQMKIANLFLIKKYLRLL